MDITMDQLTEADGAVEVNRNKELSPFSNQVVLP